MGFIPLACTGLQPEKHGQLPTLEPKINSNYALWKKKSTESMDLMLVPRYNIVINQYISKACGEDFVIQIRA